MKDPVSQAALEANTAGGGAAAPMPTEGRTRRGRWSFGCLVVVAHAGAWVFASWIPSEGRVSTAGSGCQGIFSFRSGRMMRSLAATSQGSITSTTRTPAHGAYY